jgi:hypothetical protein
MHRESIVVNGEATVFFGCLTVMGGPWLVQTVNTADRVSASASRCLSSSPSLDIPSLEMESLDIAVEGSSSPQAYVAVKGGEREHCPSSHQF